MTGMAKGAERQAPNSEKLDKAKKAASSRARGAGNKGRKQTMQYVFWVGGSVGSILVACLIMLLNPDRGPGSTPVNDVGLITHINRNAKTWSAQSSPMFEGWTVNDAKMLEGVGVSSSGGGLSQCQVADAPVPDDFDLRTRFPQCFSNPIYSMGNCTASWAIAAASALSNRFCMSDPAEYGDTMLSPQQLLSCDVKNRGCAGGDVDTVWNFIEQQGLVSEVCFPYEADGSVPCEFQSKCKQDPLKGASHCLLNNEAAIKREVFHNGPVVAPVFLMNDFLVYRGGLYQPMQTASPLSDERRQRIIHAVKIVGWGVQSRKKYWLVENSWGAEWGEQGYAKVLAAEADKKAGIVVEDYVIAGTPLNKKAEEALEDAESDFESEEEEEQMDDIVMSE